MLAVSLSTLTSACCRRYIKSVPGADLPYLPKHSTAFTCRHTELSLTYIIQDDVLTINICQSDDFHFYLIDLSLVHTNLSD
jgi:hypothetical protein